MKIKNRVRGAAIGAASMLLAVAAAACGSSSSSNPGGSGSGSTSTMHIKVAFVYNSPANDNGWDASAERGRIYLTEHVPGVTTTVLQNIAEGASSIPVFERLAQQGYKVIFAASYGYNPAIFQVAKKYPNTDFFYTSGYLTAKNVSTYYGATEQGLYLLGMLAAKTTKTNTIGFIGSFPIPSVLYQINAWVLGARSVNPNIKARIAFASSWYNPSVEATAAKSLISEGADVLSGTQNDPAVGSAAQSGHALWEGFSGTDMTQFGGPSWEVGELFNWGPYFVRTVREIEAGTWKSSPPYYGTMADGNISLTSFGSTIPSSVRAFIEQKEPAVKDGSLQPFAGPIYTNTGSLVVAAGKTLNFGQLNATNYFVRGIVGAVPK